MCFLVLLVSEVLDSIFKGFLIIVFYFHIMVKLTNNGQGHLSLLLFIDRIIFPFSPLPMTPVSFLSQGSFIFPAFMTYKYKYLILWIHVVYMIHKWKKTSNICLSKFRLLYLIYLLKRTKTNAHKLFHNIET